jgi:ribosome-associated translation inhibitor RaiA
MRPEAAARGAHAKARRTGRSSFLIVVACEVLRLLVMRLRELMNTRVAHIRAVGPELDADQQTYIRRKLGMKLGKFATFIARVTVRVEDVNGPRGGADQVCRIKVVLNGLPTVVVEARDASLASAIDGALAGTERAVRRRVQRRRMKPIKGLTGRDPVASG